MNLRKIIASAVIAVATASTLTFTASPASAGICTPGIPIPPQPTPQRVSDGPASCTMDPIDAGDLARLRLARLEAENARLKQENASLRAEVAEVKAVNVDLRAIADSMASDIKELRAEIKGILRSKRHAALRWVADHLKPCKVEDSRNCVWWAGHRGNEHGRNFVDLNGKSYLFGRAI